MHFEIFVEDISGEHALRTLLPKILTQPSSTYKTRPYKGIGNLPPNMHSYNEAHTRQLLTSLPGILKGYGKLCNGSKDMVVIVVCDLDDRNEYEFHAQLQSVCDACNPKPAAYFCFAIEEMESWLLGDKNAITAAYRNAKHPILRSYQFDSICGTWEILADIIYRGGASKLKEKGYKEIGIEKCKWADAITPLIDIENNKSPSFCKFRDLLRSLESEG